MKNVQGSIVALVTPFADDGSIDYNALGRLIDFQIANGTNALLVNGTTGESPTLSLEEFDALTKYAVKRTAGRIPVIAGTGSNNTEHAVTKSCIADYNGVDGLLVVSPYYNKPTANGLRNYFGSIASSTSLPIILYNVPGRTGSSIPVSLIRELSDNHRNIQGIKEASGSMERIMELIQTRRNGFMVYTGDDHLALNAVLMGGDGCVSVIANQIPRVFSQMLSAGLNGEIEMARDLHYAYYDLMKLNFIESNPIPVKTSLYHMGLIDLNFRSPMCRMEEENEEVLVKEMKKLNLLQNIEEISLVNE